MSDLPAKSDAGPDTGPADEDSNRHRSARPGLGRLSTYIASFAGGMAVNDVSGSLGYHGLAGAFAFAGVVTAAVWIRGLDPRAPLPRYGTWLFLIPAACAAVIAAFSSGLTGSVLTITAVVLTLGAVLLAKELESAARLLAGTAFIAGGAAVIAVGAAAMADRNALYGAAVIAGGPAVIGGGPAVIAFGAAAIAVGAATIAFGAAAIAFGAAMIDPSTIVIRVQQVVDWATKAPRIVGEHKDESQAGGELDAES